MGFYGQVVYEFTKLFSKFLITQTNSSEAPIIPPVTNQSILLEADNMWEQVDIKPTNRWIQLNGVSGNAVTKTVEIGHSTAGTAVDAKQTISVEKYNETIDNAAQLQTGDCLKIATTNYDAAGHLVAESPTYHYYNLPKITVNVDDKQDTGTNDNFYIKGDSHWISAEIIDNQDESRKEIVFSHLLPSEGDEGVEVSAIDTFAEVETIDGDPIQLNYGDLIATSIINKDDKGHILNYNTTYYKLPISQSEEDFTTLQNNVNTLQERLNSCEDVPLLDGTTTKHGTYEELIQRVYSLGDVNDLYHYENANQDLVSAIGKLDGENGYSKHIAALEGKSEPSDPYSISEAITALCDEIQANRNRISILEKLLVEGGGT